MFDVAPSEFLLVAVIALVVIGPKDLPRVMRYVGNWVGKARRVASQFRSQFDDMVRQSELQEMEQKWKEENERIMRMHPQTPEARQYDSLPPPPSGANEAGSPELPLDPPAEAPKP